MKKLFRFIILILVIVTGVVGYLAFQDNVKIPNSMVKGAVMTKFPIEKSYPGGKIKLYNPKTVFKNNKIVIEANYINEALNDKVEGKMTFDTDIKYDLMKGKLYLNEFQLEKVIKDSEEVDMSKHPLIRLGLGFAFNQLEKDPVLDLNNIEKFQTIKDIKIKNNKIVIEKAKL